MLIIKTDQPNTLVVTVSQNSELTNPEYLFSFTHIFSKQQVNFIPVDISTHKSRYDEFYFVEGSGVGEINFPYQGQYLYVIYEQPSGSGNLNPSLATNVVENGDAQIFPSSASTMDSAYDIYISNNEDNSNIIFAPDEPNPGPPLTPSITPSNSPTPSSTPTPSTTPTLTPTITPTPSSTPQPNTPSALGALWWIDFTDASTLTIGGGNIQTAVDKIGSVVFSAGPGGPTYDATGYLGVSGDVRTNATQLKNPLVYGTTTPDFTWFGRVYDDVVSQRGGKIIAGSIQPGYPSFTFQGMFDLNTFPYPPGPVWTFKTAVQDVNTNIQIATWTNIAHRVYWIGGTEYSEVWENGSIIASGTTAGLASVYPDPVWSLMFDGGIDFNTEQFYFDRKLSNSEMTDMFTYLNNKY